LSCVSGCPPLGRSPVTWMPDTRVERTSLGGDAEPGPRQGDEMGRKLPPKELELYERCDEVLHYIWDPIGVAGAPGARDEYESYLPKVFTLLRDGAGGNQIADYLLSIETDRMGLAPNRDGARKAAVVLLEWREWIAGETP